MPPKACGAEERLGVLVTGSAGFIGFHLPYSSPEGIDQTAAWLRECWAGSTTPPRIRQPERGTTVHHS